MAGIEEHTEDPKTKTQIKKTMAGTHQGIQEGKDIMLFLEKSGAMKPTAAATSHKVSYKASTKSNKRVTKDAKASKWDNKRIDGMSCTISVNAFKDATAEGVGYNDMLKAFKTGTPVKCKYGYSDETGQYEEGMFIITDISEDAPADGDATWSASLESTGEIETKGAMA